MSQSRANPIAVEVTRGQSPETAFVESRHRASCAVVAADGTIVHGWGDVDQLVFPRSAIKPIQALPLIETGAADAFGYSAAEISLACASHHAEDRHVEAVTDILGRIGLTAEALECGPKVSIDEAVKIERLKKGVEPSRLRSDCSGKHTGFLATAMHMGEDPAGYIDRTHPVQQRIFQTISEMCDVDVSTLPEGIDGCSIPALAIPLSALALGMAKLANPGGLGAVREAAADRVVQSIAAEPFMMAGTGHFCTAINAALKGKVVAKTGAEGMVMVAVPAKGLGIAIKVDDGDIPGRVRGPALVAVLKHLGVLDDASAATLKDYIEIPVHDFNGRLVGLSKIQDDWPPVR
ncbi:MAG: asparaginase [Alphaproteobacteria bacterium]|nr:asparaginase [Alphaproteobacteria bacterium]MBT4967174.1 asparaginase [Alphaproteobacteria bacterium]MBT5158541.1 asparaginase [Alphaproteobacteria bacterium]MBT6385743.1 asparaginase [Alphaproteobacteria bacterium]